MVEQRFCKAKAIGSNPLAGLRLRTCLQRLNLQGRGRTATGTIGTNQISSPARIAEDRVTALVANLPIKRAKALPRASITHAGA